MNTTRFPNGVTNVAEGAPTGELPLLDPSAYHTFFDDYDLWPFGGLANAGNIGNYNFNLNNNGDVTPTTETGLGQRGGWITVHAGNLTGNISAFHPSNKGFTIGGEEAWFKCRFKRRTAANTQVIHMGLCEGLGIDPGNGLYFVSDSGTNNMVLRLRSGAATIDEWPVFSPLPFDDEVTVAFHYEGSSGKVRFWASEVLVGEVVLDPTPIGALTPTVLVQAQSDAAYLVDLDYILAVQERQALGGI